MPNLGELASYLVGSLSFAVIVSRAMGLSDPRTYGSGNPGATNAGRVLGRRWGVLVGVLEDDPTLEPRDILVMCPDIETFAPLVAAGFGLGEVVERGGEAD